MGKLQLIYFPVRGRGESIRLLLTDNDIDFTEINCLGDWQKEWKPQMQFGQVPCLKDDNMSLVQSNAILRHLGRKYSLYGSNLEEQAKIDIINDGIEDLRCKYSALIYRNYEAGKQPYIDDLKTQLLPFEKLLAENQADKCGFSVGSQMSFVDYNLFDMLDIHVVLSPSCLDDFTMLRGFYKLFLARPNVAKYRQTEEFKSRNINGNGKQ